MVFAALQAQHQVVGVGVDVDDDLVQVGFACQEEFVKAFQHDALAGLELGHAKRPGAHHIGAVAGVHFEVGAVTVNMLGNDGAQRWRHGQNDGGVRRAHADDGGVGVGRFHRFQVAEHGAAEIAVLLPDLQRGEGDVGGGERLAVVPGDALAQGEGEGAAVCGTVPGGGEAGGEAVLGGVGGFGQGFDDLAGDEEDAVAGNDGGVEVGRLGIGGDGEAAAALLGEGGAGQEGAMWPGAS